MIESIQRNNTRPKTQIEGTCLHIGCGLLAPEDWKNVDVSPSLRISTIPLVGPVLQSIISDVKWPKSVEYGDIVKGLNVEKDSCALIFSAHVLEHISLSDFQIAMNNIYSYLKPGGVFRAIVPDLEHFISLYNKKRANQASSAQAAHEFMSGSFLGYSEHRSSLSQRLRHAFCNSRHLWMWDEPSLSEAFTKSGFKEIRVCQYGDWTDPRFEQVEKEGNYIINNQVNAICIEGYK